jgi:hypothetical protein
MVKISLIKNEASHLIKKEFNTDGYYTMGKQNHAIYKTQAKKYRKNRASKDQPKN